MFHRYLVLGAGAVGCAMGGLLQHAGASVRYVARGPHRDVLRERGLDLRTPSQHLQMAVDVVDAADADEGEVILLCTKSQDSGMALDAVGSALSRLPVVCAQNGVANERLAAARAAQTYGAMVFSPASFLEPGRVTVHSDPCPGIIDVGLHPHGIDERCSNIAADLTLAGFDARACSDISRLKHTKLLANLGNALQAIAGNEALMLPVRKRLQEEAMVVLDAAGIGYSPLRELYQRCDAINDKPVDGVLRAGGSSWQSLQRGCGSLETRYFNGEIARIAKKIDVPAPLNAAICRIAEQAIAERWPAAKLSAVELSAALEGR
jgi:2-dehydropantoate 2-reductase